MARRVARRSAEERSRRRFARRQWARRWVTWRYVAVVLVLALLVGGAVYAVYYSPAFEVREVEVAGAQAISDDEVSCVADVPMGGSLATVDLRSVERRVEALAAVRSAEVTRRWPHTVLVELEERRPVAVVRRRVDGTAADDAGCVRLQEGEFRALDVEGVAFGSYKRAPDDLPRIESTDGSSITDPDALAEAVAVAAALTDDIASRVDHLEIETIDQIVLVLGDGRQVRWGSADASAEKAEVLLVLLQRDAEVYDVSVPGQPTTTDRVAR